jgi:hypothetical protein
MRLKDPDKRVQTETPDSGAISERYQRDRIGKSPKIDQDSGGDDFKLETTGRKRTHQNVPGSTKAGYIGY